MIKTSDTLSPVPWAISPPKGVMVTCPSTERVNKKPAVAFKYTFLITLLTGELLLILNKLYSVFCFIVSFMYSDIRNQVMFPYSIILQVTYAPSIFLLFTVKVEFCELDFAGKQPFTKKVT